jgi:adenylate kinase
MVNLVFLGPPGAGKGTLSDELCCQEKLEHLSTGDLLRAEIKRGTPLGQQVQSIVQQGGLVSDEIVATLVEQRLAEATKQQVNGFVFDGFPRTIPQAVLLGKALAKLGLKLDATVLLDVHEEVLILRLTGRRVCRRCNKIFHLAYSPPKVDGVCDQCQHDELYQRADDNEVSVRERLKVYEAETKPLIDYYRQHGTLLKIDASRDKATNIRNLRVALAPYLRRSP